jgi:hypothetical protein
MLLARSGTVFELYYLMIAFIHKNLICFIAILVVPVCNIMGQTQTENVIVVTLDGYRWQEIFNGVDNKIARKSKYVSDQNLVDRFRADNAVDSRKKLMPFFWNVIAREGQLYGNRNYNNRVNCSNIHLLSYPGYSEMFVGFPDRRINSNKLAINPNSTVLEFIHTQDEFNNRVAAFSTWKAFPYIFREELAQFHINSGHDLAQGDISETEIILNNESSSLDQSTARADVATFSYAKEFLKRSRPRVLFLGFDETDSHGHGGRYDQYLNAAHRADSLIQDLWNWVQTDPEFKDHTTLFITTDHGRGNGKNTWKNHRLMAPGSGQIWFAVMGPDTPAFGEMKMNTKLYQKQVAKTLAAFLGLNYSPSRKVGPVIQTMVAIPGKDRFSTLVRKESSEGKDN